jgi:large subunit ribosomal protein L3
MNLNQGLFFNDTATTEIYTEDGTAVPVTAVEAGPCTVLQIKTAEKEGYNAIQIGFADKPARRVPDEKLKKAQGAHARYALLHGRTTRPMRGHFFKAGEGAPKRIVRELRLPADQVAGFEPGQEIKLDIFEEGEYVDVAGTSKGHGFTGVVKRHGFAMFPKSHGTHEWTRHGGSIGCRKPMRTRRGQRMPGQDGNTRVTVQNLRVVKVMPEQNVLLIRGGLPGPNGGFLVLRKAIKR